MISAIKTRFFHRGHSNNHAAKDTSPQPIVEPPATIIGAPISERGLIFVQHCCTIFETYALQREGIFRISGERDYITKLKCNVNGSPDDIEAWKLDPKDISEVSSLFKLFFRLMPNPILTFELYDCWIAAFNAALDIRPAVLRKVVSMMPELNRKTLHSLAKMLFTISKHAEVNLMNVQNLSIVFSPNILRPRVETPEVILGDARASYGIIAEIITHHEYIFCEGDPDAELMQDSFVEDMKKTYSRHRANSTKTFDRVRSMHNLNQAQFNEHLATLTSAVQNGDVIPADSAVMVADDAAGHLNKVYFGSARQSRRNESPLRGSSASPPPPTPSSPTLLEPVPIRADVGSTSRSAKRHWHKEVNKQISPEELQQLYTEINAAIPAEEQHPASSKSPIETTTPIERPKSGSASPDMTGTIAFSLEPRDTFDRIQTLTPPLLEITLDETPFATYVPPMRLSLGASMKQPINVEELLAEYDKVFGPPSASPRPSIEDSLLTCFLTSTTPPPASSTTEETIKTESEDAKEDYDDDW